ncbi:hypothetical protein M1E17_21110 [Arthrobacter sp. D1-29]
MHMKKTGATIALTSSLLLAGGAMAGPASAQVEQAGLVNVNIGDVTVLEDVRVAVAANIVANVCNLQVNAVLLAANVVDTGGDDFTCVARGNGRDIVITQDT